MNRKERRIAATEKSKGPAIARADAWQNLLTGMGDPNRDKITQGSFMPIAQLDYGEIESLYYGDDMAQRIVDALPDEAFRRGFELEGPDAEAATKGMKDIDGENKLRDGYAGGRCWGGAALIIGANDGKEVTAPLDVTTVSKVDFVNVWDRRFLQPSTYYEGVLSPKFGQPQLYSVNPVVGGAAAGKGVLVHESRMIRFYGTKIDPVTAQRLAGWSYSVLQRPYEIIRMFATAFASAAQLMSDAGQAVFEVQGLMQQIAGSQGTALLERFTVMDMQRSSGRMILTEMDKEKFRREPVNVAGIDKMLEHFELRLAAAARMPLTFLYGKSPDGENATGESDAKLWNNSVKAAQSKEIEPALVRLLDIITAGKWSANKENKVLWMAMEEPNDLIDAQVKKLEAETWKIYSADIGAVSGEQVAMVQFLDKPMSEVLDEKTLQAVIDDDNKTALDPEPPPVVVAPGGGAVGQLPNGTPGGPQPAKGNPQAPPAAKG